VAEAIRRGSGSRGTCFRPDRASAVIAASEHEAPIWPRRTRSRSTPIASGHGEDDAGPDQRPISPIRIVSHAASGPAPDRESRERAGDEAVTITEMTLDIDVRVPLRGTGNPLARRRGGLELAEQPPGDRGDLVDCDLERLLVSARGLAVR